jgi:nicotinate-nucleotide adenylyltransferase
MLGTCSSADGPDFSVCHRATTIRGRMPIAFRSAPVRFGSMRARPPLVLPGQRVGLLGGSFNPPHAAHLQISEIALRRLGLDRVWWIITPGNPLKSKTELAPLADRVAACRALVHTPRIDVTTFETALPSSYTAATLAFLKRRNPGVRFVWLMGADNLASFHHWQHWHEIASAMPIAVIDRPRHRFAASASVAARALAHAKRPEACARRLPFLEPPAWVFLTAPLSDLSSTRLRHLGMWRSRNA